METTSQGNTTCIQEQYEAVGHFKPRFAKHVQPATLETKCPRKCNYTTSEAQTESSQAEQNNNRDVNRMLCIKEKEAIHTTLS